ncbi:MAG: entericidin A/B family lipoprotein [Candidatus Binatia bacterium]
MRKAALLLLALLLGGCATLRGMAEDIQNLGRGLKKTVSDDDDSRR